MTGQAIVSIKDKQWTVAVANTLTELTSGLSGVESIPPQTGVLFDLGYDQQYIEINMSQMLFALDIIFINSTQGVVGVLQNVQPGEQASLENEALPGARCFLEVNAGEATGIEVGDNVNIQGYVQAGQLNVSTLIDLMCFGISGIFLFMIMRVGSKALGETKEKPVLPGREIGIEEKRLSLEETGRGIAEQAGVKFVRLEEGWQAKYATPRYWFKDAMGNEIIATDLEELKWKLSAVTRGEKLKLLPEKRPRREGDLEYLADSPEFLTQTIEAIGYRDKLDTTFQEAITRAKGLK